jgi:hypothetical protein
MQRNAAFYRPCTERTLTVNRPTSCLLALVAFGSLAFLAPACQKDDASTPTPDAGSPNGDAGVANDICPTPTGPTRHSGDVKDGEVWTAVGSPHIVEEDVYVRNGATLTIEPCAEVRIAAEKRIDVASPLTPNTGKLVAEGTANKPIKFTSDGAERWGSIYVVAPGTARFAYATFENGGGERFNDGATLVGVGSGEATGEPLIFVDNVTIKKSRGTGIWLQHSSTFIAGSKDLTVTESGDDEGPYPLEISDSAIDALPTGKYTGNKKDEILIRTEGDGGAASGVSKDATLHERGVPYHMGDSESDYFVIAASDGHLVTLTIEPGVVMKFEPKTAFMVQHFTTDKPSTAVVHAQGTADKPIVFTSAAAAPKAGDWRGIWFGGVPQAANVLDHVRIEYAGYDCGCSMVTCSNNVESYEGAVVFSEPAPSAFITNTVFKEIAGHAVTEGWTGALVNFRPTNTFEGVTGCIQTMPGLAEGCPDPRPQCDGM